ncbi:MAG: hypothetical protein IJJ33_07215 [Victivallales bacterium]|nr:hypothetical protein [Victivallales bacterium]
MRHWLGFGLLLFCDALAASAADALRFHWIGMRMMEKAGVIELNDDSDSHGLYLLTAEEIAIAPSRPYLFSVKVRRAPGAANRPLVVLRIFDKDGKQLRGFSATATGPADEAGFRTYVKKIASSEWPPNGVSAKILLQPAAGLASAMGKAEFKEIRLEEQVEPETLQGQDITYGLFFKFSRFLVSDEKLKYSPFAHRDSEVEPRIEFVASQPYHYRALQLVGRDLPTRVKVSFWQEESQSFLPGMEIVGSKVTGGYAYDLSPFPECYRLAVDFPGQQSLSPDGIRVYAQSFPQENWNANWIWCGRTRIDNIDAWLRREYEFPVIPRRAILQCAADDVADVFVNGKCVGNFSGRENPPNYDITEFPVVGKNVIGVKVHQFRYSAGFLGELDCRFADGHEVKLVTDKSWLWSREEPASGWNEPGFDASAWKPCVELGKPPQGEWGKVKYRLNTHVISLEILNPTDFPTTVQAGERRDFTLRLKARGTLPSTPFRLLLRQGQTIFQTWNIGILPTGDAETNVPFSLRFHAYLISGEYTMELQAARCEFTAAGRHFLHKLHVTNDRHAPLCDARLRRLHGVPTLFIGNQPIFANFSTQSTCTLPLFLKHHRIFHAAGWDLTHLYFKPDWNDSGIGSAGIRVYLTHLYFKPDWNGDKPNFSALDAYVAALLEGNPKAFFLLKVNLRDSQKSFVRRHPGECVQFDNGVVRGNCSLASEAWRKEVTQYTVQMIEHIANSPYADKVIGCCVSEGKEGQWLHYWGVTDPAVPGAFSDYSLPMLRYFRKYLKEKYGTVERLRTAWNNPQVSFETAAIPDHDSRVAHDCGFLRNPVERRAVVDYAEALSEVVVDGMEHYARLIKEKTGGRWLTGALYGHLIDVGMYMLAEQGGGLAERKALKMPHMDIFMGPLQYRREFRALGGVGSYDTPSPESCLLHDKMWVNENDLRTHMTFPAGYAYNVRATGQMDHVLAREFGKAICSRAGFYLLAMGMEDNHHWYDDPETIDTLKKLNLLAQNAVGEDRSSRSKIAVFTDDNSLKYMRQLRHMQKEDSVMRYAVIQREAIGRIGAPFDEYMQSELENPSLPKYNFYIFLNPIHLTLGEKEKLKELAQDGKARILFLFAPGIAGEDSLALDSANELTGMAFTLDATPRKSLVELKETIGEVTSGTILGWRDEWFAPTPIPTVYDRLLAVFADSQTPAAVTCGNIAFSTLGILPAEYLRMLAIEAGVEIRSTDNIAVYECASFMAIHSMSIQGECCVSAPRGRTIRQLWPKEEMHGVMEYRWKNTEPVSKIFKID